MVVNKLMGKLFVLVLLMVVVSDFRLFKGSKLKFDSKIWAVVDIGCVGVVKFLCVLVSSCKV